MQRLMLERRSVRILMIAATVVPLALVGAWFFGLWLAYQTY